MKVSSEGVRGNRNESKGVFRCLGEGVQQTGVEVNEDKLPDRIFLEFSIRPWANVNCRLCWRNASVMPIL